MRSPDAVAIFETLIGTKPRELEQVLGGGNNQLYRVVDTDGGLHALKVYRSDEAQPRPRLLQEFEALQFLGRVKNTPVPSAIAADEGLNAAVYGWIEGSRPTEVTASDIEAVLTFVDVLVEAGRIPGSRQLRFATEACLSLEELISQVNKRRTRLADLTGDEVELAGFLHDYFDPVMARAVRGAGETSGLVGDLLAGEQCLSPSDFGFHNAIRRPDGGLTFIDMEYFGWDDPVKLAADFMLHPGMNLEAPFAHQFLEGWKTAFGANGNALETRLSAHLPLYALRWTMIQLNEFLPERWQSRVFSGQADAWEAAKQRQLGNARVMLNRALAACDGDVLAGASKADEC